ncbi:MAG: AmmeMemoRadiSam system radical SAM enzyme [Syntrophorhabdaceae bacterium]|nr:AmmeMemoRadiSam system radical SAM enzyme [Syntrophorhabdaceae bacterium]
MAVNDGSSIKEALFYERLEENQVRCLLCRHRCTIKDNKRGLCGVRENRGGKLFTLVYGLPCAYHVDPIEKKPLFHFFPGSKAFSIATVGCNFRCLNCQNYEISQMPRDEKRILGEYMAPEEVVSMAEKTGCRSISYTYTEPTVFFEYAFDVARLAKERGLYNNFVTNGYIEEAPLMAIKPYLDGANIDLKGFSEDFYRRVCGAELSKVLEAIRLYKRLGIWIEITTLIIPGYNDDEEGLKAIASFIKDELGRETPWHVSAFYPTYRLLDAKRTAPQIIKRAMEIGKDMGLYYVYQGNVPGIGGEDTYCHNCGRAIILRTGYTVTAYNVKEGRCFFCNGEVYGVGM